MSDQSAPPSGGTRTARPDRPNGGGSNTNPATPQYAQYSTADGAKQATNEPTGWVGWIVFAAIMMMTVGALHVFEGIVALFKDTYYVVTKSGLVVSADYTAWGWVHIIGGVIVAAAGAGLLTGKMWARVLGIVVAAGSLLVNFAFMAAYPVWSITLIAIDVMVIFALTAHGKEMRQV
jgi:hypothetical protein